MPDEPLLPVNPGDNAVCQSCKQIATRGSTSGRCYADNGELIPSEVVLTRAGVAASSPGWAQLGRIPTTGLGFNESEVLYNPDDRYWYIFNTEYTNNLLTSQPFGAFTWVASGINATVTLPNPHSIP